MIKYKGLVFDLDGTLLNTIEDITDALNASLQINGYNTITKEDALKFIGNGVDKLVLKTLTFVSGINPTEDLLAKFKTDYLCEYQKCSKNKTAPFNGIVDVLNFLKNEGYKLAVLSNKPHTDVEEIIKYYFPKTFDFVSGAKSGYSVKPDPSLLNEILEHLGLNKEEVLFVGDSDVDIITAHNAGVDSVGALYGFRTEKELRKTNATYYIKTPRGLLKHFRKDINGVIMVDKPVGYTSQDIVTIVKNKLNVEKAGHAGTLDPFASGVLVVLLGEATKISDYLLEENKEYEGQIIIGKTTTTLDCEGEIILEKTVNEKIDVDAVLQNMLGEIELIPPMYSAIKVNGDKLCDLARKGKMIEMVPRKNTIFSLDRVSDIVYEEKICHFNFKCLVSKGTYIRSVCEEIGKRLGYPAYLKSLRRIKSGQMLIENAVNVETIQASDVINILDALKGKRIIKLNEALYNRVKDGRKIYLKNETNELVFLEYNNKLLAIYQLESSENKQYAARRVWK